VNFVKYTTQDREQLLRDRQIELRLKEIETEIHRADTALHQTEKEKSQRKPARTFKRDLAIAAKLSGFFVASVVVVVAGLSFFICIATAGWLCFELGRKSS
jgi:lipid II:glycine glycyltransferase (peptidoglycan interpeptide bridge formation enzyme)